MEQIYDKLNKNFFKTKKYVDIYTLLEGEKSFLNIIKKLIDVNGDKSKMFDNPIDGWYLFIPSQKVYIR